MSVSSQNLNEQTQNTQLLDIATKIAISAIKQNPRSKKPEPVVNASTINSLLSFLQSRRNMDELLLYIMRQAGRGEIDEETGKLLLGSLKDRNMNEALNLLGYVKWIYDTLTGLEDITYDKVKHIKTFKELVSFLSKA
ncbi:hypothetical protein DFR86_00145 [Acidianus sulfidivorans JP7]|uniref:CRISPR type III-B/RAMP module-associated protein Cmr5 n=1 Tax=Acidianus sulfidivorans JP7 TaxID=619593 RepID=A0A2U9IQB7_9CREN|nr:hypothetical protein [Acidianus sulfidivorans]AWR98157.1 hypothetical protein DFR86_00145 [Acidianus sulfidivorans JP7]